MQQTQDTKSSNRRIVQDEQIAIENQLRSWISSNDVEVVISTGGTGVTGRDVTPEAFHAVYEKEIVGFGELFRQLSYETIAELQRFNHGQPRESQKEHISLLLPGSGGAVRDAWDGILQYQLDIRHRPLQLR